jgi:hypothetical protein
VNHGGKSQTSLPERLCPITGHSKRVQEGGDIAGPRELHRSARYRDPKRDPLEIKGLKRAWRFLEKHFSAEVEDQSCGFACSRPMSAI